MRKIILSYAYAYVNQALLKKSEFKYFLKIKRDILKLSWRRGF